MRLFSTQVFFLLLTAYCLLPTANCTAQSFQWGKRAGSAQSISETYWERVNSMATDVNGNLYALGHVAEASINVDGNIKNGNGGWDIVLASFTCSGTLRWWKVIGGPSQDRTYEICADKMDGIYLSCYLERSQGANTIRVDADTTFSGKSLKGISLIKYDTSGKYKWFRAPQADTIGTESHNNTADIGMDVDDAGNVYWMWQMAPSVYFNGTFSVPSTSDYLIKYDRNGNLLGTVDLKTLIRGGHLKTDPITGRLYYAGLGKTTMSINGVNLTSAKFIIAFDKKGKIIWQKQGSSIGGGFYGNIGIDKEGSVYLASALQMGETFNGFTDHFVNSYGGPCIIKLDSNGNTKWVTECLVNGATTFAGGTAIRNSGEVVLHGSFPGLLKWEGAKDTFNLPKNSGYRPYLARFSTQTGKVLGVEQVVGSGLEEFVTIPDGRNNVYLGGDFLTTLSVGSISLSKAGGESDWYILKYGHNNCGNCAIPEPKFAFNSSGQAGIFTYAGTLGITKYKWDFGDGDTSTAQNPTHSFKDSGNYIVCVNVTNNCGDNTYCQQVHVFPTDVPNITTMGNIKIYPNPANEQLIVSGLQLASSSLQLVDMYGKVVYTGSPTLSNYSISTANLIPGMYLLRIVDKEGNRLTQKIIKQ